MNKLVRALFETLEYPAFSAADIQNIEPRDNIRYALVKRAMRDGDLVQIKRGLYALSPSLRKKPIHLGALANRLYFPSYLSLEYALERHGWIPEHVVAITSVTSKNSAEFDTALGRFMYSRIPQALFFCGVETASSDEGSWLQARPLKALADYIYARDLDWTDRTPLVESLRIDEDELLTLGAEDFDEVQGNYRTAPRVEAFLAGLRKDLRL
jgi:hypothetical protein